MIADRLHQMGLAQANAAIDEQRVVRNTGVFSDLNRGGARQLICLAGDEAVESEATIEAPALGHLRRLARRPCLGLRRARGHFRSAREDEPQAELASARFSDQTLDARGKALAHQL